MDSLCKVFMPDLPKIHLSNAGTNGTNGQPLTAIIASRLPVSEVNQIGPTEDDISMLWLRDQAQPRTRSQCSSHNRQRTIMWRVSDRSSGDSRLNRCLTLCLEQLGDMSIVFDIHPCAQDPARNKKIANVQISSAVLAKIS